MNRIKIKRVTFDGGQSFRSIQPYQKRQIRLVSYLSGIDYSSIIEALELNPKTPFIFQIK